MSWRVLVMGSSNTDLVCGVDHLPTPGETVPSYSYDVVAGGKAANQAVAAARAGADVAFLGAVGDDAHGCERLEDLEREGIDVSFVQRIVGSPSGLAFIFVDRQGENQIVTFGGSNDRLDSAHVEHAIRSAEPELILMTLESPPDCTERVVRYARKSMATLVVNAAPYDRSIENWIEAVDVLIVNAIEARQLAGGSSRDSGPDALARTLRDAGPDVVAVTLGGDGVVLSTSEGTMHRPALDVDVVDTTGAGDAFCGAMAAAMARGMSPELACRFGVVAGGLAAERPGAQPSLPTLLEIQAAFERLPAIR